ncbi:hypothetical protein CDAR_612191 [Caerostris darwini]|uniref:Uncharacterized protein n=1 Tax=Caerostris darwini TaxID=1538125 RepID=A0AAV4RYA5_9ARAC|nr:hypothetical protein CDAR_612191 [Caerostris darwini]
MIMKLNEIKKKTKKQFVEDAAAKATHSPSRHHYKAKNTSWAGFVLVQKVKAACDGDAIADVALRHVQYHSTGMPRRSSAVNQKVVCRALH